MSYAVVQSELVDLDPAVMRRAFRRLEFLTDHDADAWADQEPTGFIVRRRDRDEAGSIVRALSREGIAVEAVAERDLLALPGAKWSRRLDVGESGLTVFDTLGRPRILGWDHVVMVAAGLVGRRRIEHERREWIGDSQSMVPVPYRFAIESLRCSLYLELLLDVEPLRVRVDPFSFDYRYLGERKAGNIEGNFLLMVCDLVSYGVRALKNRGAESLSDGVGGSEDVKVYKTERHFEEEVLWLIWRSLAGAER